MDEVWRARRHRIAIQKKSENQNSFGEIEYEWLQACETWAEIRDNVITIRYQPELLPGDRVVIGNTSFEIVGVIDIKAPTRLVKLEVKEIENTGRRRFCPAGQGDEQQQLRAFAAATTNASDKEF